VQKEKRTSAATPPAAPRITTKEKPRPNRR
jgi:hypothetical protein